MKKGYTHITVVLDRSGSMHSIAADTVGGFNTFLEENKKTANKGDTFSLMQFDDVLEYVYKNVPIKEVSPLVNGVNFAPRGSTALLDAMGKTIVETGEYLKAMVEKDRPETVIFVVITDGGENASKEFKHDRIKDMIKIQTEDFNWKFTFLAANQDAIAVGGSYGFAAGSSLSYGANKAGVGSSFQAATRMVNSLKTGDLSTYGAAVYGAAERTASMGRVAPSVNIANSNIVFNAGFNPAGAAGFNPFANAAVTLAATGTK
jgi:hypothetical protein